MKFVQFDLNVHREDFYQMNIEYLTWLVDQIRENYQIDMLSIIGSVQEYVEDHLEPLMSLKPPGGVVYMMEEEGQAAGVGALQKLRETVGEVKWLYIRPQYRGRGYGKQMAKKLLDDGRRLGCSFFLLDTAKFMAAAQHIYRSVGFKERDPYPESKPPEMVRPYWIWMEKKD
jgi:ribosomal protein S18 acetylase RimI-like enzyme